MGGLWYLRPVIQRKDAFPTDWLDHVRQRILNSPLLAASTLNAGFAGTQGYSLTFKAEGRTRLDKHFPEFTPYLESVIQEDSNAWFLNPLLIMKGNRVAPHIDCSLKSWCRPDVPPYPQKVSVLYVQVPDDMEGGQLILHRRRPLATVTPQTNLLVEFKGNLRHEVCAVECSTPRISLVLESYQLPDDLLDRVPDFFARSKRPFEEFMSEAIGLPTGNDSD